MGPFQVNSGCTEAYFEPCQVVQSPIWANSGIQRPILGILRILPVVWREGISGYSPESKVYWLKAPVDLSSVVLSGHVWPGVWHFMG